MKPTSARSIPPVLQRLLVAALFAGTFMIIGSAGIFSGSHEGEALAESDAIFRAPADGIELPIPEGFVTREVGNSSALDPVKVAVAPNKGGFPTLNIIVHPPLPPGRTPEEQILDEYRLAGFTDVKLVTTLDAPPFWIALELQYTQGGTPFTAHVGILPAPTRSYLVTAIAPTTQAAEGRALFMSAISKGHFDRAGSLPQLADSSGEVHSSRTMAIIALALATVIAIWYWRAHHLRKSR